MKFKQKLSFFFKTTTFYKRYTIKHTELVNLHSLPLSCLEMVNIKNKKIYDTVQSDICSKLAFHNRFLLPAQEWCNQLERRGGGVLQGRNYTSKLKF